MQVVGLGWSVWLVVIVFVLLAGVIGKPCNAVTDLGLRTCQYHRPAPLSPLQPYGGLWVALENQVQNSLVV